MATDKKELEENIKMATLRIANNEYLRITAKNATEQALAMVEKSIWQNRLAELEKKYHKLSK